MSYLSPPSPGSPPLSAPPEGSFSNAPDPPARVLRPLSFSLQRRASLPILSSQSRLSFSDHPSLSSKPSTPPPAPIEEDNVDDSLLEESERNEMVGELKPIRMAPLKRRGSIRSISSPSSSHPSAPPPTPSASNNAMNELATLAFSAVKSTSTSVFKRLRGEEDDRGPTIEDPMMESMNYDNYTDHINEAQIENSIYSKRHEVALLGLKICITMIIAVLTASCMYFVTSAYKWLFSQRVSATVALIQSGNIAAGYFQWVGTAVLFTSIASIIVAVIAPAARGSGVAYALAYLNGTNCMQFFTLRVVVVKVAVLCFTIAGGLTLGAEGPFVFLGAGIAILLCKSLDKFPAFSTAGAYTKLLRNIKEERVFMAGGVAAGLAVAFSAPITGILFALEGSTAFLTVPVTLRIFSCSMFAILAYGIASNGFSSAIQSTNIIVILTDTNSTNTEADGQEYAWQVPEIFAFTILAIIGGLLGAFAVKINLAVTRWRHQHMNNTMLRNIIEIGLITVMTTTAWYVLPFIYGCRPLPSFCSYDATRCQQLMCPAGSYSEVGSLVFSYTNNIARNLFDRTVTSSEEYDPWPLASYGLCYVLLVSWAYGAYIPGGLFVPAVVVGAVYGRIVGNVSSRYVASYINPGIYSMLGAAGMLGGFTRLALPVVVMLCEMTGDATYLLPIMYIATLAKLLADYIEPPLYPQHMGLEGIPTLGDVIKPQVARKAASDLMNTRCYSLRGIERLGRILFVLTRSKGILIPLVDDEYHFVGWVSRNAVVHAIKYAKVKVNRKGNDRAKNEPKKDEIADVESDTAREYILKVSHPALYPWGTVQKTSENPLGLQLTSSEEAILEAQSEYIDWSDTKDSASSLPSLGFDSRLYHDLVNLYPYSDTGAYTCRESTSAKRIAALFRRVGVSHLAVCDENMVFKGVITRRIMVDGMVKPDPRGINRRSSVWKRDEAEEERKMLMDEDEDYEVNGEKKDNQFPPGIHVDTSGSITSQSSSVESKKVTDEESLRVQEQEKIRMERERVEAEDRARKEREEEAERERLRREDEGRRAAAALQEEERRRKAAIEKEIERERRGREEKEREKERAQKERELREKEQRENEEKERDQREKERKSTSTPPTSGSPPSLSRSIAPLPSSPPTGPTAASTAGSSVAVESKERKERPSVILVAPSSPPRTSTTAPPITGSMSALFAPLSPAELAACEAVIARAKAKKEAINQKLAEQK